MKWIHVKPEHAAHHGLCTEDAKTGRSLVFPWSGREPILCTVSWWTRASPLQQEALTAPCGLCVCCVLLSGPRLPGTLWLSEVYSVLASQPRSAPWTQSAAAFVGPTISCYSSGSRPPADKGRSAANFFAACVSRRCSPGPWETRPCSLQCILGLSQLLLWNAAMETMGRLYLNMWKWKVVPVNM